MKKTAIYPGSFDPITNGHLDIIKRASRLFDEVIVAILVNADKSPFFSSDQRLEMLKNSVNQDLPNVQVNTFGGLLVEHALEHKAQVIIRGIRAVSDYEYELQMALMNRRMEPQIETVFMMPAEAYSYLSSRLVREIFQLGGSVSGLVPTHVEEELAKKIAQKP